MTVYPPVSVFLGDCGKCQLELDGGELAEGSLASTAVVGALDPHEDRVGELGSRGTAPAVEPSTEHKVGCTPENRKPPREWQGRTIDALERV